MTDDVQTAEGPTLDELKADLRVKIDKAAGMQAELERRLKDAPPAPQAPDDLTFWHRCPAVDEEGDECCGLAQWWDAENPAIQRCINEACAETPGVDWVLLMAGQNHNLPVSIPVADDAGGTPTPRPGKESAARAPRKAAKKQTKTAKRKIAKPRVQSVNAGDVK